MGFEPLNLWKYLSGAEKVAIVSLAGCSSRNALDWVFPPSLSLAARFLFSDSPWFRRKISAAAEVSSKQ